MHLFGRRAAASCAGVFMRRGKRVRRAFVLVARWSTMGPMKLKNFQRDSGLRLMKHVPGGKSIFAVALTAMLVFGAHAADDSCVRTATDVEEQGVFALDAPNINSSSLKVECTEGSVSHLAFSLESGRKQRALLSVSPGTAYEIVGSEADGQLADFIGSAVKDTGEGRRVITLEAAAPESAQTGDTFAGVLKLGGENGTRISVVLEVTGRDELFRSDFGADPLIGQFSLVR